jgi:hypothetical protein
MSEVHTPQTLAPTTAQYSVLQDAFVHFNEALFAGRLPPLLITLQRQHRTLGYYCAARFAARAGDKGQTDELALNPASFHRRGLRDVLSTMVHEQCHQEVQHFGKPVRRGYHDRQWANRMKAIGLHPSNTGEPGGKELGYHMDHYIIDGGPFDLACAGFMAQVGTLWGDAAVMVEPDPLVMIQQPKPKRIKFICSCCGVSHQLVPSATLDCRPCSSPLVPA